MNNAPYSSSLKDGTLTIAIGGRVDSGNASELSKFCDNECTRPHNCLVLDMDKLEYISSAGLRAILAMLKKESKPVKTVNIHTDVYEILDITGFTQMLDARRALRQVSIDGCEKIGLGRQGGVYRLDKDTIIKVFMPQTPLADVEKERNLAHQAFVLGVPTAISYDIVKCGDSLGVVYELLNANTLVELILKEPDKLSHYAGEYARIAKKTHSIDVKGTILTDAVAMRKSLIQYAQMKHALTEKQAVECMRIYDRLHGRKTFLHGDFNPNNVMVQDGEMLLIDMGAASCGHPIIDIESIYMDMAFVPKAGVAVGKFSGEGVTNILTNEQRIELWDVFIQEYFGTRDRDTLDKIEISLEFLTMISMAITAGIGADIGVPDEFVQLAKDMCAKRPFPKMEDRAGTPDFDIGLWG